MNLLKVTFTCANSVHLSRKTCHQYLLSILTGRKSITDHNIIHMYYEIPRRHKINAEAKDNFGTFWTKGIEHFGNWPKNDRLNTEKMSKWKYNRNLINLACFLENHITCCRCSCWTDFICTLDLQLASFDNIMWFTCMFTAGALKH